MTALWNNTHIPHQTCHQRENPVSATTLGKLARGSSAAAEMRRILYGWLGFQEFESRLGKNGEENSKVMISSKAGGLTVPPSKGT